MKKIHSLLYAMEQFRTIGKIRLMKFIFFADLISLNQRGLPVFDSTYMRMRMGPVDQFSFSIAGESNEFFDITVPKAISAFNSRFATRGTGRARRRSTIEEYKFTPKVKADTSLFSTYEMTLFDSVLRVLRSHDATSISEITHQLRLWQEYSDGDIIPPEALNLEDYEKDILRDYGFFFDGFSQVFCSEIVRDAHRLEELVVPLRPERKQAISSTLDRLVRAYPVDTYGSFYDAYLAWDDAYRVALERDPGRLSALAETGGDALCTYALGMETGCLDPQRLGKYVEIFTRDVEELRTSILMQSEDEIARPDLADDSIDRLMQISCELALQR